MSFVDELNGKGNIGFDFNDPKREELNKVMDSFESNLKHYCFDNKRDRNVSKYLALKFEPTGHSGVYRFDSVYFRDTIQPYHPKAYGYLGGHKADEYGVVHESRNGEYYISKDTRGIFSKEMATELAHRVKSTLTKMGFHNISVDIEPLALKKVSKIRKALFATEFKFRVTYADLNQTGYLVHFKASW